VFLTEPKKTAEDEHCIGDLAGCFVDHQPLNRADCFAAGLADGGSFDAIAGYQAMSNHGNLLTFPGKAAWHLITLKARSTFPRQSLSAKANVAEDIECQRLAREVESRWGRCDALINNAGTTKFVPGSRPLWEIR
jgi:NAD(P)-dependent dehydrogenase (short-subunit alcohol dehydrogenase family)